MRTPEEILALILRIAREDERIRAVTMGGSRANQDCPAAIYGGRRLECSLFGDTARTVAAELGFAYDESEEKGIADYMKLVRDGLKK